MEIASALGLRRLLTVKAPKKPAQMIEDTMAKGRTSARVGATVRAQKGVKARGGNTRPLAPADLHELVLQMNQVLDTWENRHEQMQAKEETTLTSVVERLPK